MHRPVHRCRPGVNICTSASRAECLPSCGEGVHKLNLFFTCRVGHELRAILLPHARACFCIGFAGAGQGFLVLGGFLRKRELPCSWCVERVGGRKGAQGEELLSCSFPDVWSKVQCLSWRRSPSELLRFPLIREDWTRW